LTVRVDIRAAFFLALAVGLTFGVPAWAQSDTRGLVDRLDRIERDLSTLQGQVYRGQGSGGPTTITSPALGGSGGAINGDAYSSLDQRLSALEQQLRDMTGQVEKATFAASQMTAKLDRMQADNDLRFKELEQKAGVGAAATGVPPAAAGAPAALAAPAPATGSPPGFLGKPAPAGSAPPPPAAAVASSAGALPAGKKPQEQYDYAFTLVKENDYDGATKAFQAFVAQHPQDPLAGNAMFWLGQIPYVQGQYDQAARMFYEAYSKYPNSAKAGESLLKVGLAMSNLSKKKEACSALTRFNNEFPDAGDSLRRQASAEKQKLGC
jgi:tol-pal system protein YbgF